MQFDKSYWTAMDKESFGQYVNPGSLGISSRFFEKQLPALQASIKLGAKNVELGFMGQGKGSVINNITPGMHSKTERDEMRQLAKINEVNLSTHANVSPGFSGMTERGFSEEQRAKSVNEIKRAVEFAADVTEGGPVVIHAGEVQRPIHGVEGKKFKTYAEEGEHKIHYLVDGKSGNIVKTVKEDEVVWLPEEEKDAQGNIVYWEDKTYPDIITGEPKPVPKYKIDRETGRLKLNKKTYQEYKQEALAKNIPERDIPAKFLVGMNSAELEHDLGQAERYEGDYIDALDKRDAILKAYKRWKNIESGLTEEKKEIARKKFEASIEKGILRDLGVETRGQTPEKYLKSALLNTDKQIDYAQGVAISSRKKAHAAAEKLKNIESLEAFALKKSAESVSDLAMFALEKEKVMKKKGHYKKPLFISPEAVFPEQYGSHPDELKQIVQKSREVMVKKLMSKKKMSKSQANKVASAHIKCTFDVGHINTWRKYFDGTDEAFDKWLVSKAQDLQEKGYLGHIHLSDNFGYEDEHLASGEGNAPIKKFIAAVRKKGYKGPLIVEGGGQGKDREHEALMTSMRHFNSPMYTLGGESVGWGDIEHSYFGSVRAGPSAVVGAYAPDSDLPTEHRSWTLWSGVPFE